MFLDAYLYNGFSLNQLSKIFIEINTKKSEKFNDIFSEHGNQMCEAGGERSNFHEKNLVPNQSCHRNPEFLRIIH